MSSIPALSVGAIQSIFQNSVDVPEPVVQVVSIKTIIGPNGEAISPPRYRLVVSDGLFYHSFMLATQKTSMITDKLIENRCIIRLDEYNTNDVRGRRIMIVLRLTVLHPPTETIGKPVNLEVSSDAEPSLPDASNAAFPAPPPSAAAPSWPQQQPPTQQAQAPQQYHGMFPPQQQPAPAFGGSFGGGAPPGPHMPQQAMPRGAFAGGGADEELLTDEMTIPIKAVSPYRNRWVIKGRVTTKGPIHTWENARGSGKLFKFDVTDVEGSEISLNAFNKAVDKLFPLVQEGKVYFISKGVVKGANRKFNTTNSAYEIQLDLSTIIQPAPEVAAIPRQNWAGVRIADLRDVEVDTPVTVVAVVMEAHEPSDIPSRQRPGERLRKRTMILCDRSRATVEATLWGEQVDRVEPLVAGSVIGLKGAKVSPFNGLSLSVSGNTIVELNPDVKEAHELLGWWRSQGQSAQFTALSTSSAPRRQTESGGQGRSDQQMSCAEVRQNQLGNGSTPDYFSLKATVTLFRKESTLYYRACPTDKCNKKVNKEDDVYRCEKCDMTFPDCLYRYIMTISVSDHTGQLSLSCFNESATMLLGHEASEVAKWKETNDVTALDAVFDEACFKTFKFKCRARAESYNEERRVKYNVLTLAPVDYIQDSIQLIQKIQTYLS